MIREKVAKLINFKDLDGPRMESVPGTITYAFVAIVRIRLDYISFLYDSTCKIHLNKLDIVQK